MLRRKRRLFAQQDLSQLLVSEGYEARKRASLFKLDIFDNTDYESRLPSQWVPKTPGVTPTPATVAIFDEQGDCSWEECIVVDYDEVANTYAVLHPAGAQTEGGAVEGVREPQWVPRINLCFSAEDPFVFAKRHAEAHASRSRAESLLRYNLYIDSMPMEDIPPLSTEQVNRMLGFALNSKKLKDKLLDTSQLIQEVNIEYARTMNKIAFDEGLKRGHSGCAAPLLALGETFPKSPPRRAPPKGCVPVAEYDFPQQFSDFSFRTLLTKGEVISALGRVRVECAKVLKMRLFNTYYTKSLRLDEFEQGQMQNTDQVGRQRARACAAGVHLTGARAVAAGCTKT